MTSYYMLIIFLCKIRALQIHDNTSFSPVTSTNVGFGPKTFLTFSFNTFATQVQNFKFLPSASPKLLNLDQDHPSKKAIFLVKSLQNWGYDNFSHRNATVTNFAGEVMDRNYDVMSFISKYLYFKRAWGSHFCWHHQNCNHVY